jgi:hypothetical protein
MSYGNSSAVRELVPKGYHFDAYNKLNSPNSRDRPFFEDGIISIGKYHLLKRLEPDGSLLLQYDNVCHKGHICFKPYRLSFDKYVEMLRKALKERSDFISFEIPIEYGYIPGNCWHCEDKNRDCSYLIKEESSTSIAAVSFNPDDIENALSEYFGIKQSNNSSRGGKKMKTNNFKKMFGMNLELGVSTDTNIAATFMGVAIKNPRTGDYHVYDPATQTLKNYANMKFGDFRVFLLPDQALQIDQLYKLDGKYYYVRAVEGNTATLIDAVDGTVITKILSECLIPGMNFYTRVVALDPRTMFDPNSKTDMSKNVLAAICMTQWSKGESDFSLDGIGDDSMNGLGMLLLMGNNKDMSNNLPMLLAMGALGNESDNGGMMQYWLLNQIMNGGTAGGMDFFSTLTGTAPATPAIPAVTTKADTSVVCPDCGEEYQEGTNFCSNCGAHTVQKGKHCMNCGTKLNDGAKFCHHCGHKVVTDTCPKCNAKVPEGAKFCSECGTDLTKSFTPASPKTKSNNSGKKTAKTGGTPRTGKKTLVEKAVAEKPAGEVAEE